ncbi:hypothetical protein HBH92_059580 [Parastagonospora nodorum]|nr:hypothetical protein HBH92_059580 [Parastagonospora nodorum]KAH4432722.1 hypothetical protein HBH93_136070 [Parastagonospora nodorum]KAH4458211.1 hypothetical protein HBH91_088110 [Parastagonospora nodorum]KAH4511216.1 hypothetical protein HBH89_047340 [Parastagonospora nodorum]KAH4549230.1 hypothetical protein HBH85_052910 [Parastagonospora nodorum]
MLPLTFGPFGQPGPRIPQSNLQVLYDASAPMKQTGLAIYIRHPSSLRPATANAVHIGTRLYLQTVGHAFHDIEVIIDTAASTAEEDLVLDSDSESDVDYSDEIHIDITSAASQSLETFSFADSDGSECSHSPSTVSNLSTPRTSAGNSSQECELNMSVLTRTLEEVTPSRSLVPAPRNFAVRQPLQPSEASLKSLGRVIDISEANDWALIEITTVEVEERLRSSLNKDAPSLAYERIAVRPPDAARVYTCTASGQKLFGYISDTCSSTRLPNGKFFRDIYVARLEDGLSNGDCGAVFFDARTHETYGHLIAGCQRTGTAHILAAHQTATDLGRIRKMLMDFPMPVRLSPNTLESLPSEIELQDNETHPEMSKKLPVIGRAATTFSEAYHKPEIPWKFLLSFAKRWDDKFSNDRIPGDTPYMDELKLYSPTSEGISLFLEAYAGDTTSFDLEAVIRYCQDTVISKIREQGKPGSAWMDDRTYVSYYHAPVSALMAASKANSVLVEPEVPPMNQDTSRALYVEYLDHASENVVPPRVERVLNAGDSPTSNRYIPDSRRYPAPLTAELLFENLRKKRYKHPDLPDSDRRLVFVANPDGYDIIAVTETAPQHLHEALGGFLERYVSLRTALKVKLSDCGFPEYQIQYHLPHFVLRKKRHPSKRHTEKLQRARTDLSFLSQALPSTFNEEPLELVQAQISIVLCGTSETRYTVYCFEDSDHDDDREMGDDEFSENGFQADQIAKGEIDANRPIWNPREYILVTLLKRITQVAKEWARVVHVIDSTSARFACGRTTTTSGCNPFDYESIVTTSSWIRSMLQVLRQLLRTIRETIKAWETFKSDNGDIGYFSDLVSTPGVSATRILRTLHQIHAAFDDLKDFHEKMLDIQEEYEKLERALEVRMMVETNKNTEIVVLFICPVAVVSTFFAIPTSFLTFPRNMWSFTGGVILITVFLYLLHLPPRGRSGHGWQLLVMAWWSRMRRGTRENTIPDGSVPRAIRQRATHPAVRE